MSTDNSTNATNTETSGSLNAPNSDVSNNQHQTDEKNVVANDEQTENNTKNVDSKSKPDVNDSDSEDDDQDAKALEIEQERERQKLESQNFKKSSFNRFMGAENIRPFIYIGVAALVLVGAGGYFIVDKATSNEDVVKAESKANIPNTRVKSDGVYNAEQAEYMNQQQQLNANKAEQEGGTYLPQFIQQSTEVDTLNSQPIVQPGMNSNTTIPQQYFDKNGNSYSHEQALQMAAQNQRIEGVTYGVGSIEDQNNQPIKNSVATSKNTATTTQSTPYTPYSVTPYNAASRNTDKSTQSSYESEQTNQLDQAAADTAQWQQNYLALRQKKAQLIDQKSQKAFENQVTRIIESTKPVKNAEKSGSYQVMRYKTSTSSATSTNTSSSTLNGSQQARTNSTTTADKPLARTGDTFKAIIKTKVNTDEGNDVLATITTGVFKGSTLMGTAKATNDNVQITFTKLIRKGKPVLAVNAVARSLDGNSLGMADSIKRHYAQKYSALVTASLLSGVGQAYQQTAGSNAEITNGTVVTTSSEPSNERILGNAAGELGNQLSSDIRSLSNRPTTYIVNQGKVFNLFLNADVVETTSANTQTK